MLRQKLGDGPLLPLIGELPLADRLALTAPLLVASRDRVVLHLPGARPCLERILHPREKWAGFGWKEEEEEEVRK